MPVKLSVVVPCFNEENTLRVCVERVLQIEDPSLDLEVVIVDDGSTDRSVAVAHALAVQYPQVTVLPRQRNQGKGAAVRAGFQCATGDFIAVQDADLEYDPQDLRRMLVPLIEDKADVVFGSRFLSVGAHRVLYFWHYLGNYFLTALSNMFTDLNMTDMESGYKVFRCDVIRAIRIEEERFGFEPEIVAKVAHLRPRIFEIGISYYGRTYEEGKKIGFKDGLKALYCILKYNTPKSPWFLQFLVYLMTGAAAAAVNGVIFVLLLGGGLGPVSSAAPAFAAAASTLCLFCFKLVFRHNAKWSTRGELILLFVAACTAFIVDLVLTGGFLVYGLPPWRAKLFAFVLTLVPLFPFLRLLIFPEPPSGPWRRQETPPSTAPDPEDPYGASRRGPGLRASRI